MPLLQLTARPSTINTHYQTEETVRYCGTHPKPETAQSFDSFDIECEDKLSRSSNFRVETTPSSEIRSQALWTRAYLFTIAPLMLDNRRVADAECASFQRMTTVKVASNDKIAVIRWHDVEVALAVSSSLLGCTTGDGSDGLHARSQQLVCGTSSVTTLKSLRVSYVRILWCFLIIESGSCPVACIFNNIALFWNIWEVLRFSCLSLDLLLRV